MPLGGRNGGPGTPKRGSTTTSTASPQVAPSLRTSCSRSEDFRSHDSTDRKHRMSLSCPMQTATRCFRRSAVRRDRKSVVWGKSVDLGGRRIIKKKKRDCELFIIRIYNWYMSNYTCKM